MTSPARREGAAMRASDHAREAIAEYFWPIEPKRWDGPADPTEVVPSDGDKRTIGQRLDALEKIERALWVVKGI